jgi:hypothetical protein
MSNAESIFGSAPGRFDHEPVTSILIAMRDAWLAGMGFKQNASRQSMAGDNPGAAFPAATPLGPMISVLGAMADFATASRQRFDQPGAGAHSAPGGRHDPVNADFLLPMGGAMMIAANRSVSYWLGLAQIIGNHQMTLAQAIGAAAIDGSVAGPERLVTADRLRSLLREMGDLATKEARIFQDELNALDESFTQTLQQREPSGSYRRRWRAKV